MFEQLVKVDFLFLPFSCLTQHLDLQEQVNSEDNLRTIVAKVKDENKTPGLIRQLDFELGQNGGTHQP